MPSSAWILLLAFQKTAGWPVMACIPNARRILFQYWHFRWLSLDPGRWRRMTTVKRSLPGKLGFILSLSPIIPFGLEFILKPGWGSFAGDLLGHLMIGSIFALPVALGVSYAAIVRNNGKKYGILGIITVFVLILTYCVLYACYAP